MDGTRKYAWFPGFRKEARIFLRAQIESGGSGIDAG